MATYLWVGGYTGFTGTNSGWTLTGGGTGGNLQLWTSVVSGATSTTGDNFFAPYAWNLSNNWRVRISLTGNSFGYIAATGTPASGDAVLFGGVTSGTGNPIGLYNISCLYGGLSGDGPLSHGSGTGSTGWANGTTASRYGDVTFTVSSRFKPTTNPWGFRTGEIGIGVTGQNDFTGYLPLRIRASSFSHEDGSYDHGFGNGSTRVSVKNLSSTTNTYYNSYSPFGTTGGNNTVLSGAWYSVYQGAGSLFLTDCTTTWLQAERLFNGLVTDKTSTIENVAVRPTICTNGVRIWGSIGGPMATLKIYGWGNQSAQNSFATIGDFGSGTNPTFTIFECGGGTSSTGNGPIVKLATTEVEYFQGDAGTILVHPEVTKYDYCILRDGYLRNGFTINMSHPSDNLWQNFMLGYAPSDQGLRIDGPNVNIKCYAGQSLVSAPEGVTYG